MHLRLKVNQSVGASPVQIEPFLVISDRLLFPFAIFPLKPAEDNLGNPNLKTTNLHIQQPEPDGNGNLNANANDPAPEMVLHVRPQPAPLTALSRPVILHALHRGYKQILPLSHIETEQNYRAY